MSAEEIDLTAIWRARAENAEEARDSWKRQAEAEAWQASQMRDRAEAADG